MAGEQTSRLIVEGAFRYLDEVGPEKFSMRTLAQRLDMGTMSVYRYFDSKDDLVEAVRLRMREGYDNAPIPGERWDVTIRRTTASIRKNALAHPNVWSMKRGVQKSAIPHTRKVYQLHKDQGMPLEVYRPMWCILEAYLGGFISHEIERLDAEFAPVDPDDPDYPWLIIAENAYNDESFATGIELIIDGTRMMAAPDPCEWYTPLDEAEWSWGR